LTYTGPPPPGDIGNVKIRWKLTPGCGHCRYFERCRILKSVKHDTNYCQLSENSFTPKENP